MSEFKGTNGPWVTCDPNGQVEGGSSVMEVSSGRERWIASCCHYVSREEVRANAQLIAAAPELLQALMDMVAIVKKNTYPTPDKPSSTWGRMEVAEQVIAKALGQ